MNIMIQSIKFDADKKLVDYVESKLSKLNKYYDEITTVEVNLRLEANAEGENKKVQVQVMIPGNELFVEKQGTKFEEALDLCFDTLKVILTKSKEKTKKV